MAQHLDSISALVPAPWVTLGADAKTRLESSIKNLNTILFIVDFFSRTVRSNLLEDYFGSILMDRGDREAWTGDAHPSQARVARIVN